VFSQVMRTGTGRPIDRRQSQVAD